MNDRDLSRIVTLEVIHGGSNRYTADDSREAIASTGLVTVEPASEFGLYSYSSETRVTDKGRRVVAAMIEAGRKVCDG